MGGLQPIKGGRNVDQANSAGRIGLGRAWARLTGLARQHPAALLLDGDAERKPAVTGAFDGTGGAHSGVSLRGVGDGVLCQGEEVALTAMIRASSSVTISVESVVGFARKPAEIRIPTTDLSVVFPLSVVPRVAASPIGRSTAW